MRKVDLILKIVRAYKHTILHLVCTKFSQNQFGSLHRPTAYLETTLESIMVRLGIQLPMGVQI
jgi:hypothetical protein